MAATAAAKATAPVRGFELEAFASEREPKVARVHGIVVKLELRSKFVATAAHHFELHLVDA